MAAHTRRRPDVFGAKHLANTRTSFAELSGSVGGAVRSPSLPSHLGGRQRGVVASDPEPDSLANRVLSAATCISAKHIRPTLSGLRHFSAEILRHFVQILAGLGVSPSLNPQNHEGWSPTLQSFASGPPSGLHIINAGVITGLFAAQFSLHKGIEIAIHCR